MGKRTFDFAYIVLTLAIVLTSTTNTANSSLVGWWKLDETSGTIAGDSSGNGHDGTLVGNPQWVSGYFGGALQFAGSPDLVVVPYSAQLNPPTEFTVMLWANVDPGGTGWRAPISSRVPGYNLYAPAPGTGTNTWEFWVGLNPGWAQARPGPTIQEGEWTHVAGVYDNGNMKLYGNGELAAEGNGAMVPNTENDLRIGAGGPPTDVLHYFAGKIDDVRIYEKALSLEEILAAMEGAGGEGYPYALGPNPADGEIVEATWVNLSWKAGDFAVSHNVYLGDNFDDVNNGTGDTFRINQTSTNYIVGFPGFAYPNGLVPGTTYYWRIDEVNDADPNSPWKGRIWSFVVPPQKAYNPNPADGDKYIDPDVTLSWTAGMDAKLHHMYFGENFEDVNNGVVGLPMTGTTYTPATLELEKTYYWRVDEFDGFVTHKGDVWSFTTMPVIAVTDDPNLIGMWTLDEGAGKIAVDWSGYGNHGMLVGPRWVIPGLIGNAALNLNGGYVAIQNLSYNTTGMTGATVCTWIRTNSSAAQYIASFDRDNYWRLEINGTGAGPGQIGWDVMTSAGQVDYGSVTRVDDGLWHHVCGVFDKGTIIIYIDGQPEPATMGGPTFGSGNTRYGFFGANSEATAFNGNRGGGNPINGDIDDFRIYNRALTVEEIKLAMRGDTSIAWNPKPANGTTPYVRDALPLSWSPGDKASGHEVYFGSDLAAVFEADASDATGVYRGLQSTASYTPPEGIEWGGGPYYWRVDENNTDGTVSKGSVWSFTVADFLKIEDFEDYNDFEPDRIFDTWLDGWGVATNGSEVGYADPNFDLGEHHVETATVHGGFQSMPYFYDNNFKYSEASLTLASARNWTEEGVAVLSLWFNGDPANAAEKMYVSISNANGVTGTVYHDDPNAAQIDIWTEWTIDLQKFADQGVNLTNVDKLYIGFGDKANLQAGGTGRMFFDDICLKRPTQ